MLCAALVTEEDEDEEVTVVTSESKGQFTRLISCLMRWRSSVAVLHGL